MNQQYVSKLSLAYHNKNLIATIILAVSNRFPFRFIQSKKILEDQCGDRAYRKLLKKYAYIINQREDNIEEYTIESLPKIIWWCWFQGEDNAPKLVKSCLKSIRDNFPDFKINIITLENMNDYADIPKHILDKYNKGIIGAANFSDYLRNSLLLKHGGLWIDATVYCTGREMLEVFDQSPIFFYQDFIYSNMCISSWLIASRADNPILSLAKELMDAYWNDYNIAINYFIYHIFITIALNKYQSIWKQIPLYENMAPHVLIREMDNEYSVKRFEQIKKMSSFHKLNYKKQYLDIDNTFFDVLINKNGVCNDEH